MSILRIGMNMAVAAILIVAAPTTWGYGGDGHAIVGAIADDLLEGTPASQHLAPLLKGDTLAHAATWADRVKNAPPDDLEMRDFLRAHKDHKSYHYTDIPIQETAYRPTSIGAATNDLIQMMGQCIAVLRSSDTNIVQPFNQRIALMLLAHYVGDVHQPLHVGAAYLNSKNRFVNPNTYHGAYEADSGGNYLLYGSELLHAYWDDNAVARAMTKAKASTPEKYAQTILLNSPVVPVTTGDIATWPKQWADEMLPLAARAHQGMLIGKRHQVTDEFGKHLQWPVTPPSTYRDFARDTVQERLTVAGHRLAQLLEAIWPQ